MQFTCADNLFSLVLSHPGQDKNRVFNALVVEKLTCICCQVSLEFHEIMKNWKMISSCAAANVSIKN